MGRVIIARGISLATLLISKPPRERAGALAANRFDYQLDGALCRLLELQKAGKDFVVVIDFHDDVLVLDSASDPKSVICYQIKTKKTGNWTSNALLARKTGKTGKLPSILGKLYQHSLDFAEPVEQMIFVSNAPLKMKMPAGKETDEKEEFGFDELVKAEQDSLKGALVKECSPSAGTIELMKLRYKRSTLPIDSHPNDALAKLALFLEEAPETHAVPSPAFYRTLKQELARAFHYERLPTDFADLCACKAVTRAKFVEMLAHACAAPRPRDHGDLIGQRLDAESVPFSEANAVRHMVRRFVMERLNTNNRLLADQVGKLTAIVRSITPTASLWATIEAVRVLPACAGVGIEEERGVPYFRAVIGVLLYESSQLPGVDQSPAEAKP